MVKIKKTVTQTVGVIGALAFLVVYIKNPSFPTPDKLLVFMVLAFMAFGKGLEGTKRFLPIVLLLLAYESFRSVADQLNTHVDYYVAPHADSFLFGNLPTAYLQNWLWHGNVQWYDYPLYLPYFLHFALPFALGILVWRTRDKQFWRVMNTFVLVAFLTFVTYLIFPAAPPWLASQNHYIQPIVRISSEVWANLGIHDFPSIYNRLSPNAVAAVPSLHAAWATLVFLFVYKLYGKRWAAVAAIYPLIIFIGTVYDGEHYAFDIITGIAYAVIGYLAAPWLMKKATNLIRMRKLHAAH